MARAAQDKLYKTFINGLITEATGLTFPENSLRDVDNCDIELKGLIRRRLGIAQEPNGTVVGAGSLAVTTYSNNTGGPLSSNPYSEAASFSKDYTAAGSDSYTDWDLLSSVNHSQASWLTNYKVRLGSSTPGFAYIRQNFNLNSYDLITLSFTHDKQTPNRPSLAIGLGVDVNGIGNGVTIRYDGIHQAGYPNRLASDQSLSDPLPGTIDESGSPTQIVINMAKVSTNLYSATIQQIRNGVIRSTSSTTIATNGGYVEIRCCTTQGDSSIYDVSDIKISGQSFANGGDTGQTSVEPTKLAVSKHLWSNVGGIDGKNWVVMQIGNRLFFRDWRQETVSNLDSTTVPEGTAQLDFDGAGVGFIYNTTAAEAAQIKLASAVGNGRLWFTSSAVIPFYAEYDPVNDLIALRPNGYQASGDAVLAATGARRIRDFNGVPDGLSNDTMPDTLTQEHLYNLLNQGWSGDKIDDFHDDNSAYPSNAQQWPLGKDNTDDFDPHLLLKIDFGNSPAPRGRIILDALVGQKDGITHTTTGVTNPLDFNGVNDERSLTGWNSVGFYAGRVWYAGDANNKRPNGVYFSKTLSTPRDSGTFMQENDPTSEQFSDLVDTDGGVIYVSEADRIIKLIAFGAGILVMAQNGIWFIYGGDSGFTATHFSVDKVSSTGIISSDTVIATDQSVVYWADNGIQILALPDQGVIPVVQDISQTKIFELYNNIPLSSRLTATGAFDRITKKVYWMWWDSSEDFGNLYNKMLIFDTRTGAYTQYSFAADLDNTFGVVDAFPRLSPTVAYQLEVLTTTSGETITTVGGEAVTTYVPSASIAGLQNSLKLLIISGSDEGLRLADFSNRGFKDFANFQNAAEVDFSSYLITGDDTLGDVQRTKQATYIHSFFRRTETGWLSTGDGLTPSDPSSCLMSAHWDWNTTSAGNRWSNPQQAYRYRKPVLPTDIDDPLDTGEEIVYTKLKARGKGKALAVRYESESSKDFRLLGFSIPYTANGQ